ncbi:MAG: polysaccharide deacetylase family protein [Lachnospiraceae bacterium]|nr:polysaccharide deacetylase family protein [Lachnospiraceae bacterium]
MKLFKKDQYSLSGWCSGLLVLLFCLSCFVFAGYGWFMGDGRNVDMRGMDEGADGNGTAAETVVSESSAEMAEAELEAEAAAGLPFESFSAEEGTDSAEGKRETVPVRDLSSLDNTIQNWGQGVQFNSENQPVSSLDFQEKYASFQADFIGPGEKVIWLTFDEGYENGHTGQILDTLHEKKCPAVFFITGQYARENPDLIRQMIADGHAIGNHSWAHPAKGMPSLSVEAQIADMEKLHQYVKDNYDYEMTLFRYPAGIFSEQSLAVVQNFGYRSLFWSFAYADWDPDKQPDPAQALQKLKDRLHPGSIYLLHAVSATNADILGDFIDHARAEGYEFKLPE